MTTTITDQAVIASFNRGPVTAVFTPPASCLSTLTWSSEMYFGHQISAYYDPACYPSSSSTAAYSGWDVYYYSPAQCPLGWAHDATVTSIFGLWSTSLSLGPSTTAVICCPSGYSYAGYDHACQSGLMSVTSTLYYINPVFNNDVWYSTNANTPSTTVVVAGTVPYNIYGDGIPVWWQSSDLKTFSAATTTSSSTSSSSTTSNTQPSSTPTQPTSTPTSASATATSSLFPSQSRYGLSSGTKIGIGLGVPFGVIAIVLVASFIYCWRRRRAQAVQEDAVGYKYEAPSQGQNTPNFMHEMYSDHTPYNTPYPTGRRELPGE